MSIINSDALCSVDDVKNFFYMSDSGEVPSVSNVDELIETLINGLTDSFEMYCGAKSFKQSTYTEYYDGNGSEFLFLNNIYITAITSLYDDTNWSWGSDSLIDSDDYRIVDNKYIVLKDNYFTKGNQNIKSAYTAGYSTIPYDLRQSCIEEVTRKLKHRKEIDLLSKTLTDGSVQYLEMGLMKQTLQVLSKYKLNWVL